VTAALTDQQRTILHGLASGRTQNQLARDLDVSMWTIRVQVKTILAALGAQTVAHAVDIAHRTGAFNPPPVPRKPAIRRVWDAPDAIRRRRAELDEALRGYQRPRTSNRRGQGK